MLDRIRKAWDIKNHVRIQVAKGQFEQGRTVGWHTQEDDGSHTIRLSPKAGGSYATQALLHELRHAAQVEKYPTPDAAVIAYNTCNVLYGYDDNPFEIDAREAEHRFKDNPDYQIARK